MLLILSAVAVVLADQAVKLWVIGNIPPARELIPGVLSLVCVHNDGAAFSFLSGGGARYLFIFLALAFIAAVIAAIKTGFIKGKLECFCLAMIAAGGLANCIDRIVYGYVVDMFKVELFDFAVFNLADAFITVFTVIFALKVLFSDTKKKPEGASSAET